MVVLYPVFNKIICENLENNYGLFSGIIGIEKNWILVLSFLNETNKEITIKIAGTKQFCESINNRLERKTVDNNL